VVSVWEEGRTKKEEGSYSKLQGVHRNLFINQFPYIYRMKPIIIGRYEAKIGALPPFPF
jgi:hypothetical protein